MKTWVASTEKKNTLRITGSRPESGPPMITGAGCWVRHQRIAPNTMGTSIKAKMPNSALKSARRPLTSTFVLWLLYISYLLLRTLVEESGRRALLSALFGIFAFLDVPLVFGAIRWW